MPCYREFIFFFNDTATTEIYTLSLHDALPILCAVPYAPLSSTTTSVPFPRSLSTTIRPPQPSISRRLIARPRPLPLVRDRKSTRLNSRSRQYLVCRLLLEKKKKMPPA